MQDPIKSICAIFLHPATSSYYQPASALYLPQWPQIVLYGIYTVELSFHNHESSQRININTRYAAMPLLAWLNPTRGPPSDFIKLLFQKGSLKLSYHG